MGCCLHPSRAWRTSGGMRYTGKMQGTQQREGLLLSLRKHQPPSPSTGASTGPLDPLYPSGESPWTLLVLPWPQGIVSLPAQPSLPA